MKVERKSDHIAVIDSTVTEYRDTGFKCSNCEERYYLCTIKGDNNNLQCKHCGALTPIRTIKHSRGMAAPVIQQQPAIVQSESHNNNNKRKPHSLSEQRRKNPLEESIIAKGLQVIDSEWNEPT